MFSLIYAWMYGWVNKRGAGDLRRHRAHYNVTSAKNGMETAEYSDYMYDFPATKANKFEPYHDLSW